MPNYGAFACHRTRATDADALDRPAIRDEIRKVVQEKARDGVDLRIADYIPVSLQKQVEETEGKVKQVKDAVKNAYCFLLA